MAHDRVVHKNIIGMEWTQNEKGRFAGSMSEDDERRADVNCTTLLPPFSSPPSMLLPINEKEEEVLTADVDIELMLIHSHIWMSTQPSTFTRARITDQQLIGVLTSYDAPGRNMHD